MRNAARQRGWADKSRLVQPMTSGCADKKSRDETVLQALLLATAMINSTGDGKPITCSFPALDNVKRAITVNVDPKPSLKDQPEQFRVLMNMNQNGALPAAAAPIASTQARDVMIRAFSDADRVYTIGLRDDGRAALNIQTVGETGTGSNTETWFGFCVNAKVYIDQWLSS